MEKRRLLGSLVLWPPSHELHDLEPYMFCKMGMWEIQQMGNMTGESAMLKPQTLLRMTALKPLCRGAGRPTKR